MVTSRPVAGLRPGRLGDVVLVNVPNERMVSCESSSSVSSVIAFRVVAKAWAA